MSEPHQPMSVETPLAIEARRKVLDMLTAAACRGEPCPVVLDMTNALELSEFAVRRAVVQLEQSGAITVDLVPDSSIRRIHIAAKGIATGWTVTVRREGLMVASGDDSTGLDELRRRREQERAEHVARHLAAERADIMRPRHGMSAFMARLRGRQAKGVSE